MIKSLYFCLLVAKASCFYVGNSTCSKEKIVQGSEVEISLVPYVAQILKHDHHLCGASIISEYWLVTAAHCIPEDGTWISIRTGTQSKSPTASGWKHDVESIIIHDDYNEPHPHNNDIALIKLEEPIEFNKWQQPIKFATSPAQPCQMGRVSGWGRLTMDKSSSSLNSAVISIVEKDKCKSKYQTINYITDKMFCAGTGSGDSCKGDSGGPMVIEDKIAGIVSFGEGCNNPDFPGVYLDVFYYREWIMYYTDLVF